MEEEQIEKLINRTANTVANKLYAKLRDEHEKERENLYEKRLYNTKLLLEHYRLFKEHASNAIYELTSIEDEEISALEILDSMLQSNIAKGEIAVESIKNSAMRTRIIINHVDEMLKAYEFICMNSGKPEDERKWDAIKTVYINEIPQGLGKMDVYQDLADKHFISVRQIQGDIASAIKSLTALFFGIDGVECREKRRQR